MWELRLCLFGEVSRNEPSPTPNHHLNDIELRKLIKARTGIQATSAVIALGDAFRSFGAKRIGLVTPHEDKIQNMIVDNLASEGFACIAEEHCSETDILRFHDRQWSGASPRKSQTLLRPCIQILMVHVSQSTSNRNWASQFFTALPCLFLQRCPVCMGKSSRAQSRCRKAGSLGEPFQEGNDVDKSIMIGENGE